jgi:anaerobic ribonucleoside-triphosphate reductase
MGKNREKYFRCPKCGELTTKTDILNGKQGMLCCNKEWDEISKEEYEARLKEM